MSFMAVGQSFSDGNHGNAMRNVLPVLWMSICLHTWPGIGDGNRACAQCDFCLVVFAQKSSSQEYFGDLIVKVGYRRQTEGTVSIFVNG